MEALSELTGISSELLAEAAGYFPSAHRAASYQMQAASQFQAELGNLRRWIDLWHSESGLDPASSVAGQLLRHSTDWSIELRADVRGLHHRAHHATYVAIRPRGGSDLDLLAVEQQKLIVESVLRDALRLTGTVWRGKQRTVSWPDAPPLLLTTPHLERGRAPSLLPAPFAPITLPVVGVTYAHAETAAAWLADAWGFGYQNAAFATMERYGSRRDQDPERSAQADLISQWLANPTPRFRHTVWTFADYRAVQRVLPSLAQLQVPVIAAVFAGERLLKEAGATMWLADADELVETQKQLRKVLRSHSAEVVSVSIPDDEVIDETGAVSDALIWDAAMRATWKLLRDLTPSLLKDESPFTQIGGDLGQYAPVLTVSL